MAEAQDCIIAIRAGRVAGFTLVMDDAVFRQVVADWAIDYEVTELLRVPAVVGKRAMFSSREELGRLMAGVRQ